MEKYIPLLFIIGIITFCVCSIYHNLTCDKWTHHVNIVKTIGGCDKHGQCGVEYESGATGVEVYPTTGKVFKYKSCPHGYRLTE